MASGSWFEEASRQGRLPGEEVGDWVSGLDGWAVGSLAGLKSELGWLSAEEVELEYGSWNLGAGGRRCGRAEREAEVEV